MNKYLAFVFAILIGLSVFTACSAQKNDSAVKTTENETVSSLATSSDSSSESKTAKISSAETSTEVNRQTVIDADNDVDFAEIDENNSSRQTTESVLTTKPSTDLSESSTSASSKGDKSKITTDKEGWVNKWY